MKKKEEILTLLILVLNSAPYKTESQLHTFYVPYVVESIFSLCHRNNKELYNYGIFVPRVRKKRESNVKIKT